MIGTALDRCYSAGWVSKSPSDDYWYEPRGIETVAGVDIDPNVAMQFADVFACVNKVSKTHATLPCQVYEKRDAKTREPVDDPLTELLTTEANPDATGITVRETMLSDILLWGHSFNYIDWDGSGRPYRITPLPARDMDHPKRDPETGELLFVYRGNGTPEPIPLEHMWYIPGLSFNGITGVSPIAYNRESVALGRAMTQFRSAFFGNGAWAGGFIQRPLDAPQWSRAKAEQFLASLNEHFRGSSRAFGLGILREGMEFKQLDMPFEDAMFLGTARLTRIQICGIFDVPPGKIQDDERNTYTNAEQNDLVWAKDCLLPWSVRIEASARRRFFKGTKRYLRFNLAGVMRGDFKTRMEGYNIGLNWGLWSVNEVRALEEMNPVEGGDVHYRPLNMGVLGEPNVQIAGEQEQQNAVLAYVARELATQRTERLGGQIRLEQFMRDAMDASRQQGRTLVRVTKAMHEQMAQLGTAIDRLVDKQAPADVIAAFRPAMNHAAEKIVARQCRAAEQAFRKHAKGGRPDTFREWCEDFFERHTKIVEAEFKPILRGWEEAIGRRLERDARELAEQYCDQCFDTLLAAIDEPAAMPTLLDDWKTKLAAGIVERLETLMTKET